MKEEAELAVAETPDDDKPLIEVHNLGVKFIRNPWRIASIKDLLLLPFPSRRPRWDSQRKEFWALREISFQIYKGDILGVIGKNGAGKSTLLRVVAGLVDFEEGRVILRGKPALLTPGLGFRDELSGRDNVFIGGVIMGMKRREVAERFDEIVDFAELREAIDQPFRYYSDGMKARLVFSVATSIYPDILLLDELLGAGDVSFTEKAARRMHEVIQGAQALIVVTHNLNFVRKHCNKALYLRGGQVGFFGDPEEAVERFLKDISSVRPGEEGRSEGRE